MCSYSQKWIRLSRKDNSLKKIADQIIEKEKSKK
jgi:hypothetical protein